MSFHSPNSPEEGQVEGFHDVSHGKRVILFHWKDCGHCKKMMPEWDKLEQSQAANPNVDVRKVNCGENPELAEENGISGFPTIMLFTEGGDKKTFDGERTKEEFEEFIASA